MNENMFRTLAISMVKLAESCISKNENFFDNYAMAAFLLETTSLEIRQDLWWNSLYRSAFHTVMLTITKYIERAYCVLNDYCSSLSTELLSHENSSCTVVINASQSIFVPVCTSELQGFRYKILRHLFLKQQFLHMLVLTVTSYKQEAYCQYSVDRTDLQHALCNVA